MAGPCGEGARPRCAYERLIKEIRAKSSFCDGPGRDSGITTLGKSEWCNEAGGVHRPASLAISG
jgi:hypothetical protein